MEDLGLRARRPPWFALFLGHVDAVDHVEQWQGRLVVRLPRIAVEGDGS